jgi:DNA repair exonuclease SbcCD ATPase subunit
MLDLSSKLNDCVNNAEARAKFDDVKSMAENYQSRLEKMVSYEESIGKEFKDGLNRDWANTMRGQLMDKTKVAKDRAEALKRKASDKQDCAAESKALAESLAQLTDAYKSVVSGHNDRLKRVLDDYSSVQNTWFENTKDDRKQIDESEIKYRQAVEKRKAMLEKQQKAAEAFDKILEEDQKIREQFQNTKEKTVDEVTKLEESYKKSRELVKRVGALVNEMEKEVKSLESEVLDRHAELMVALETYEKEAVQSDDTLTKEVLPRFVRMQEMKTEYDGKISL